MKLQYSMFSIYWEKIKLYLKKNPFVAAILFIILTWISISLSVHLIEEGTKDGNIKSPEDAVWWGIVTLLTVGYGDRYPVTTLGRVFGGILMISGVVGIAIVTAKISSYFLERALRERRGFVETNLLKDHFIVCGWKEELLDILLHIRQSNSDLKPSQIVLLNNISESQIDILLENPTLKGIHIIKGEFFLESQLQRAAPQRASKILILSDATPNAKGETPTTTEADARTIMTAMSINNMCKGVPVIAEIQDPSMDQYLRLAHVNEIIYSKDYSKLLLALASTGLGVANIYYDLLSPKSQVYITTKEIPGELVLEKYEKLQEHYSGESHRTLIGILENSGNSHVAKEKAIKRAQQTPNVAELVKNLQSVKSIQFNRPRFGLSPDYIIQDGSMAIIIENREELMKNA